MSVYLEVLELAEHAGQAHLSPTHDPRGAQHGHDRRTASRRPELRPTRPVVRPATRSVGHPVGRPVGRPVAHEPSAAPYAEAGRAMAPADLFAQLPLTDRERDVAELVVVGLSYAQIARDLFVTQSTVSYHLTHIYQKSGVRTRHELTELARSGGPVPAFAR